MPCLRPRGERAPGAAVFEAAPLDIYDSSFPALAAAHQLKLPVPFCNDPQTNISSAESDGTGRTEHRVRDVYLNDPELQKLYPLGLLPLGQMHFLSWLTTHGRKDQQLTDEEILWFLKDSAENELRDLAATYLLQPSWQECFPAALTPRGWNEFREWIDAAYGRFFRQHLPDNIPSFLSWRDQRSLDRSERGSSLAEAEIDGVNIIGHFCAPSGLQQAAIWTKAALERVGVRTSCRDVPMPRRILPRDRMQWLGLEVFPITIMSQA